MNNLAFVLALLPAAPLPQTKASRDLAALERKLHGVWEGTAPCQGGLVVRTDGTFGRTHEGPGGTNSSGIWSVRWAALPPTLVLNCKESDDPALIRSTEVKLVQVDDGTLAYTHPDAPKTSPPTVYVREK